MNVISLKLSAEEISILYAGGRVQQEVETVVGVCVVDMSMDEASVDQRLVGGSEDHA